MSKGNTNNIRQGTDIVFADGKTRTIYPVSIRTLRKLMKSMGELNIDDPNQQLTPEQIDAMVETSAIVLEKYEPKIVEAYNKAKENGEDDPGEELEELIDVRSFGQLLNAAMGVDPNV